MMSDRVLGPRLIAYGAVFAAGITASVASQVWWALGLPFAAIVFIETLIYANRVWDFLRGQAHELVVERAAQRAVELIMTEQRHREALELISSMRGQLPDYMVDAADSGRLEIHVRDEE